MAGYRYGYTTSVQVISWTNPDQSSPSSTAQQYASTSHLGIAPCLPTPSPTCPAHSFLHLQLLHHHCQSQSSTPSPHGPPSYSTSTNNGEVLLTSDSSTSLSSAHTTKGDPGYNMATFFSTIKRSFKDVGVEGDQIPTTAFLEACESVVSLFGISPPISISS